MDKTTMSEGLEDFDHTQYEDEVRERWGDSGGYRESMRRTRRYDTDDWARIREESRTVFARLAELLVKEPVVSADPHPTPRPPTGASPDTARR